MAVLAVAALMLAGSPALAQRGGGHAGGGHAGGGHAGGFHAGGVGPAAGFHAGGFHGVAPAGFAGNRAITGNVFFPGAYRPYFGNSYGYGYRPYNYYRPYYPFYGYGGYGGLYSPYYGYSAYLPDYSYGYGYGDGISAFAAYSPYYGGLALPAYPLIAGYGGTAPVTGTPVQPATGDRPSADDAVHLQLIVPENAEVEIDGVKSTQTGRMREFASPPLKVGSRYTYKITVRYTNAEGKTVEDTRDIQFQANDWFTVDFTRPAPTKPAPNAPLPKVAP